MINLNWRASCSYFNCSFGDTSASCVYSSIDGSFVFSCWTNKNILWFKARFNVFQWLQTNKISVRRKIHRHLYIFFRGCFYIRALSCARTQTNGEMTWPSTFAMSTKPHKWNRIKCESPFDKLEKMWEENKWQSENKNVCACAYSSSKSGQSSSIILTLIFSPAMEPPATSITS